MENLECSICGEFRKQKKRIESFILENKLQRMPFNENFFVFATSKFTKFILIEVVEDMENPSMGFGLYGGKLFSVESKDFISCSTIKDEKIKKIDIFLKEAQKLIDALDIDNLFVFKKILDKVDVLEKDNRQLKENLGI